MRARAVAVVLAVLSVAIASACTEARRPRTADPAAASPSPAASRDDGPALIPTRLPRALERPSPRQMIPSDARLLDVRRVAMSGGDEREVVVTWERTLGHNTFDSAIEDNGMGIWHRGRKGWRLAFQIHETPLEEKVVGHCRGIGCYRSRDGGRVYTLTFVILVGSGPQAAVEEPIVPMPSGQFIEAAPAQLLGDSGRELFVVQDSTGTAGASIYRVLVWSGGAVYQRFRKVHGDGCIVPARRRLLLWGSVYRRRDSHCCPSYHRFAQLEYVPRAYEFRTVRSAVVPVPRSVRPDPPRWAERVTRCRA